MLDKKYDSQIVEKGKYKKWLERGLFNADDKSSKPSFTIPIPPPNITGKLHLGHAWNGTLQDIVARYKKLNGFNVLWIPGMDHAGISMQRKVEQRLRNEGIDTTKLSEKDFMATAMDWKKEHEQIIRNQWAVMGFALDFSKEKYTMDVDMNHAVYTAFVKMYESGIIYRGKKVVNWDPVQETAVSNMEVVYKDKKGVFYYFNYKIKGLDESFEVATTRPETMFADTAIIVHPEDERYKHLVGQIAINPANGMELKIIADEYVDMDFGSGAMKCTPAHDFNDFELGKKHNMDMPVCMNQNGTMNKLAGKFEGQDRFKARKNIVEKIKSERNLIKIEEKEQQVGHSERSGAIIEPYLSNQWFVNMKKISEEVLEFQRSKEGKVVFFPNRFEKTYFQWMENAYDWCISRQTKWGHRIPAWIHNETGKIYVGIEGPDDVENYTRETDVLDTWFSSGLWPFSILGWPNKDSELYQKYFPANLLVTGYDIIFFWVCRMMFQSQQFTGKKPFDSVMIHGLVRASDGKKMSKSLGNGVDPYDVVAKYGADSLRYFLSTNSAPGLDLRYDETKVESSWNFINKIWNISRYTLMVIDGEMIEPKINDDLLPIESWILSSLDSRLKNIKKAMESYEFGIANQEIYNFVYNELASVFIELSKVDIELGNKQIKETLLYVVSNTLVMLHPYIPFVTEHIYQEFFPRKTIMEAQYPEIKGIVANDDIAKLNNLILGVRQIRADNNIKLSVEINASVEFEDFLWSFDISGYLKKLVNLKLNHAGNSGDDKIPFDGGFIQIKISDYINLKKQTDVLNKKLEKLASEKASLKIKLDNKEFVKNAPEPVVEKFKNQFNSIEKQENIIKTEIAKLTEK